MSKWSRSEKARMKFAINIAGFSICDNRHGCVIFKKNQNVGYGWNKDKTHPAAAACHSQRIHAELAALIMTKEKYLPGADVFIARTMRNKGSTLGMSRPCQFCMKLLRRANIRKVFYTTQDGIWTMEKL